MKFSIITTTYNSSQTIFKCISSLRNQTYQNIELIWIDNSSEDTTYEILNKYKSRNTKLIKVKNKSISEAWNIGIRKSTGDIVGFLNSDDILSNKNIIKKISNIFKSKKCNAVYTDIHCVNKNGKIIRNWKANLFTNKTETKNYYKKKIKLGWMMPHPGLYIKKKLVKKIGFFNNNFKISFDYDYIIRLLKNKNVKSNYLPVVSVKMLIGGNSNKVKNIIRKMREDLKIIKKYKLGGFQTLFLKNVIKLNQFF